jgi:hypothetical protein
MQFVQKTVLASVPILFISSNNAIDHQKTSWSAALLLIAILPDRRCRGACADVAQKEERTWEVKS